MDRDILDTNEHIEDEESSLRPASFDEYVGQHDLKENLRVFVGAAKMRDETLDHVLFYGPPGLGKTTMSMIIANEMGTHIKITTGPSIEKTGDLVALLTSLETGDVLFIDEIHRLNKLEEESYTHVICISISSGLSGSYNALRLALEDHPNLTSFVYDTKILAYPQGEIVLEVAKLIREGKNFNEIVEQISLRKIFFIPFL